MSAIVEDILGKQQCSPSWKLTYFCFFSCLISISCKILCTSGGAIAAFSSSKECISKFKFDVGDESEKVFLMRSFTLFHVLGNSSDSHKHFNQANALFIKALAAFLSFLLSHIRHCPNFLSILISQIKYLLESKPS
jgi:hypothetical protein